MDQNNLNNTKISRVMLLAGLTLAAAATMAFLWSTSQYDESMGTSADAPIAPDPIKAPGRTTQQAIADIRRPAPANTMTTPTPAVPMDASEILEKGNEATLRRLVELDARYRATAVNPSWARVSKTEIDTLVNTDIPQVAGVVPAAYESSCRDRVCRIQADFRSANGEDWGDIVTSGLAQALPRTRMLVLRNPDGSTRIVMYAMERNVGF